MNGSYEISNGGNWAISLKTTVQNWCGLQLVVQGGEEI